jgi:hypothetical protein
MCLGNVKELPPDPRQASLDITFYTPGTLKSGKAGQLPNSAGSPPMRTHVAIEGVGPSRINNMNHAGGLAFWLGGAVIVHVFPAQENAGKIVL